MAKHDRSLDELEQIALLCYRDKWEKKLADNQCMWEVKEDDRILAVCYLSSYETAFYIETFQPKTVLALIKRLREAESVLNESKD